MTPTTKTKGDRTMPPAINDEQTSAAKNESYHATWQDKDLLFYFDWEPHGRGYSFNATPKSVAWLWEQFPETFRLFLQEQGWTAETFGDDVLKVAQRAKEEGVKPASLSYPTDTPAAEKWRQEALHGDTDYKVWEAQARGKAVTA